MDEGASPPTASPAASGQHTWLPRRPWPPWLQMYPTVPGREPPADLPERLSAGLLDLLFVAVLVPVPIVLDDWAGDALGWPTGLVATTGLLALVFGYSPVSTARWGGTPGKRIRGLRVAHAGDGAAVSYRVALGRHLTHLVLPVVSDLWFLRDEPLQQCLHDKAAGTVVVCVEPEGALAPGGP
ncbi:RDD family protein [Streptomyces sp. HSW2009]|uniref:RDD family protein n=1 Tax=Streptomyces sp. HSW2009 TaxID=3142890 RepID=UPI0032EBF5F8